MKFNSEDFIRCRVQACFELQNRLKKEPEFFLKVIMMMNHGAVRPTAKQSNSQARGR